MNLFRSSTLLKEHILNNWLCKKKKKTQKGKNYTHLKCKMTQCHTNNDSTSQDCWIKNSTTEEKRNITMLCIEEGLFHFFVHVSQIPRWQNLNLYRCSRCCPTASHSLRQSHLTDYRHCQHLLHNHSYPSGGGMFCWTQPSTPRSAPVDMARAAKPGRDRLLAAQASNLCFWLSGAASSHWEEPAEGV